MLASVSGSCLQAYMHENCVTVHFWSIKEGCLQPLKLHSKDADLSGVQQHGLLGHQLFSTFCHRLKHHNMLKYCIATSQQRTNLLTTPEASKLMPWDSV